MFETEKFLFKMMNCFALKMIFKKDEFCTRRKKDADGRDGTPGAEEKDEFCINVEKSCIKNEKLCIKNKESCIRIREFCIKNDEFRRISRARMRL